MADEFNEMFKQVSSQTAEDFMVARKRLRDARARWIEENECPTEYQVKHTDKDGNPILNADGTQKTSSAGGGFFQIGKRTYDINTPTQPVTHKDPELAKELLDGIDVVLSEALHAEITSTKLVTMKTGDETNSFLMGKADASPHPPIEEGEDYGEYVKRVSSSYQKQVGSRGGTEADIDRLRAAGRNDDSLGERRGDGSGASDSGEARPLLGHFSNQVLETDAGPACEFSRSTSRLRERFSEPSNPSTAVPDDGSGDGDGDTA